MFCVVVRDVYGVAVSSSRLYVVHWLSSYISVYDVAMNYKQLKYIELNGLVVDGEGSALRDIVVCSETQQLFASDWRNERVIRLTVDDSSQSPVVEVLIQLDFRPYTMSIRVKRLLITPDPGMQHSETGYDSLRVYDIVSRQLVQSVPLASHVTTWHAVETQRKTFVVCQRGREDNRQHNEVRECKLT